MPLQVIGSGFGRTATMSMKHALVRLGFPCYTLSTQSTIFDEEWIRFLPTSEAGAFLGATLNDYFEDRMHDRDYLLQRFEENT
ncbi:sulfotransferase [Chromatocurvus halotolerans]|uniref:Sulfotransferase family protein n=1 Tax=Chromatocurvus halotolerans TaxID=1132028 RepID=A0A4R2KR46_9GAMM|nr:sulfotransferase [Chromatocurvus halotolerans]TCO69085.1 hypothetical protein EV688_1403 [Chromatocurvus halotolerans]